jgi:hypothetical protein
MERIARSHQLYQPPQERLLLFVTAIDREHGCGCRACHRPLPPRFRAVYVATSATPGVSGQLHAVCSDKCSRQVLNDFIQNGATAESWSGPRVRELLDHDELIAELIGVREMYAGHALVLQFCTPGK